MTFHHVQTADESREVAGLLRRVFGLVAVIFGPAKPKWAIYARNDAGEMLGGVILKKLGKHSGVIEWIFVDKAGRGQGLGPQLLERGLAELEAAGCTQQFAFIRNDNTPSWNMFATRGFSIPNGVSIYLKAGLPATGYILLNTFAVIGYSMWYRDLHNPAVPSSPAPGTGFAAILLLAAVVGLLPGILRGWDAALYWFLPMVGGITMLRFLLTRPIARTYGPVRFQVSHGGVPLSLINGFLGAWWPVLGFWVPRDPLWHESQFRKASGRASMVGWIITIAATFATYFAPDAGLGDAWRGSLVPILFFQAIPGGPFEGLDGFRVFHWSKPAWVLGVVLSAGVLAYGLIT